MLTKMNIVCWERLSLGISRCEVGTVAMAFVLRCGEVVGNLEWFFFQLKYCPCVLLCQAEFEGKLSSLRTLVLSGNTLHYFSKVWSKRKFSCQGGYHSRFLGALSLRVTPRSVSPGAIMRKDHDPCTCRSMLVSLARRPCAFSQMKFTPHTPSPQHLKPPRRSTLPKPRKGGRKRKDFSLKRQKHPSLDTSSLPSLDTLSRGSFTSGHEHFRWRTNYCLRLDGECPNSPKMKCWYANYIKDWKFKLQNLLHKPCQCKGVGGGWLG